MYLRRQIVYVVQDADPIFNWMVWRQALKVRSVLRRLGIEAYCCAPPILESNAHKKGVDDHLGAGRSLDDLVIDGPEPPMDEIRAAVDHIEHPMARRRARDSLENFSLYSNNGTLTGSFSAIQNLLGLSKWHRVVPMLEALDGAYTVERGTFDQSTHPPNVEPEEEGAHDHNDEIVEGDPSSRLLTITGRNIRSR